MASLTRLIGSKLRKCRHDAGITQPALAKLLQLSGENSHITISNWERGMRRPTLDHIEGYAKLFDKPLHWFFSDKDKETTREEQEALDGRPSVEGIIGLINRVILKMDKIGPNPKLETAKHSLHRVLMDLDTITDQR